MPTHMYAPRLRRRLFAVVCGVSAGALSACLTMDDSQANNRYGSINLRASGSEQGPYRATATAVFFTGGESALPNSLTTSDQCGTFPYTVEQVVPGDLTAGSSVELVMGGVTSYALAQTEAVPRVYVLPAPGVALYEEGDSAVVNVPGVAGGFPAGQIKVQLAEPVRLGTLTPIVPGEDYPISWETNGNAQSGIIISMRYASAASDDRADQQVLCIVRDNGAYTISGGLLSEWSSSNPAFRVANVLRWRTNEATVDERSKLHIVSLIDTTVANIPAP